MIRKIFLTVVGVSLAALLISAGGFSNLAKTSTSVWSNILGISAETKIRVVNYAVRQGDTFSTVMEKFGFSSEEVNQILYTASDIYDFTKISAGNIFQVSMIEGVVDEIRYDIDNTDQIIVKKYQTGFEIDQQEIEYERVQRSASGEVNRSLFLDALEAGLEDKTILELAEVFAWDVDFATDIREGDEFAVVYDDLYREGSYVGPGRIVAGKFINQGDEHYAFYFENREVDGKYFDLEGDAVVRQFLKSPLSYARITSGFSYNRLNPVTKSNYGPHRAIDYGAPAGTLIYATGQGRVAYAGWGSGLGLYVKISHGGVYDTVYAHMSNLASSVYTGGSVSQGQVIGYVGSTGYATGSHLHYEMHKYGSYVNPLIEKLPPGDPIKEEYVDDFQEIIDQYKPLLD